MSISYDKEAKLEIESTERDFIQLNKSGTEVFKIDADGYTYSNTLTANSEHAASYGSVFADKSTGKLYLQDGAVGFDAISSYSVTTADAENTTDLTTIASVVIPANTWEDYEPIIIRCYVLRSSNSTSNFQMGQYIDTDGTAFFSANPATSAVAKYSTFDATFIRRGTKAILWEGWQGGALKINAPIQLAYVIDQWAQDDTIIDYTKDFTTDIELKVTAKWAVADSSNYIRVLKANAYKYNVVTS